MEGGGMIHHHGGVPCAVCANAHSHDGTALARAPPAPVPSQTLFGAGAAVGGGQAPAVSSAVFASDIEQLELVLKNGNTRPNAEFWDLQLQAARKLRTLLQSNRAKVINEMFERQWTPVLLTWLSTSTDETNPHMLVETLWSLSFLAQATEHAHVLIKHGAAPILVQFIDSPHVEVVEQAAWVLGNLAGESIPTRDSVLAAGALVPLVRCLNKDENQGNLSLLRCAAWTLSNLCDGQPRPVFDINFVMPVLSKMLKHAAQDEEVMQHACWALSHLCDGPSSHIQVVVHSAVCIQLVELLMHKSWKVTKPALRAIGNIVCAEDDTDYAQHVIDCGAVPRLRELIAHNNREIQKEACWTLSNIAAGTVEQIQCVLESGSIPPLVLLASSPETDPEVKSEACWVVLNATSCGSDQQIEYLVRQGCVDVLANLLSETSMVMMSLEGLERILQVGDEEAKRSGSANPYAHLLATATKRIEELESHKSTAIAKRAGRIWKQHFVTCAICSGNFSKHSPDTRFCGECKCHVCKNCNCTVFHLSYQESMWAELENAEDTEKDAKAQKRSKKKANKKKKQKERKAAEAKAKADAESRAKEAKILPSWAVAAEAAGAAEAAADKAEEDGSESPPSPARATGRKARRKNRRAAEAEVVPSVSPPSPKRNGAGRRRTASTNGAPEGASREAGRGGPTKSSPALGGNGAEQDGNKLLATLLNTGSMLELAAAMGDEDDDEFTLDDEDDEVMRELRELAAKQHAEGR